MVPSKYILLAIHLPPLALSKTEMYEGIEIETDDEPPMTPEQRHEAFADLKWKALKEFADEHKGQDWRIVEPFDSHDYYYKGMFD